MNTTIKHALAAVTVSGAATGLVLLGWAITRGPSIPPPATMLPVPRTMTPDLVAVSEGIAQAVSFPPEEGVVLFYVTRVIDGDTVEGGILVKQHVRLAGINAPPETEPAGVLARNRLMVLTSNRMCVINIYGREKYGRLLADLIPPSSDGKTASQILLAEGLAKPYSGKGPRP